MDAQPQHIPDSSPIYQSHDHILRLLQKQYDHARHMPNPQQPLQTTSLDPAPNHNTTAVCFNHYASYGQETTRRPPREVVTGLPRAQTFKRQQSERREHLISDDMSPEHRRAAASDRKHVPTLATSGPVDAANSFATPTAHGSIFDQYSDLAFSNTCSPHAMQDSDSNQDDSLYSLAKAPIPIPPPKCRPGVALIPGTDLPDTTGMLRQDFDALIQDELENVWILNLSMHFRDRSKREKFFVTYRERDHLWRRVTISLDYRNAPLDSLEGELAQMTLQRDKSAKIYEAIRDSLPDIHFYDTVTNLKLQTSQGRLHVHVVEDANEIIEYPLTDTLQHLKCWNVKESDVDFDSHMSGFVYKVRIQGETFVKKEIPGRETIEEFLYEIYALHSLQYSEHVIRFRGLVTDDDSQHVKALLIDYSPQGALIDRIYDECKTHYLGISWRKRERWARQIIHGIADLHEAGFVQGDLTLANVVLDDKDNAKIIDINRRGCPIGWEAPEAKPIMESNQRLSLHIGVKSDLFQLGMVLWALAMEEDEPEIYGRPLLLGPEVNVPDWYRQITEICLSYDPRSRLQAIQLLTMIPDLSSATAYSRVAPDFAKEENASPRELSGKTSPNTDPNNVELYTTRGRSPPSPIPSDSSRQRKTGWAANLSIQASYDDVASRAKSYLSASRHRSSMPTPEYDRLVTQNHTAKSKWDQESSCCDETSKASMTPPASLPVGAPSKQSYVDSGDSGIFMSTSEKTPSRPCVGSQPEALSETSCKEVFENRHLHDAARSALLAILDRQDGLVPGEDEAVPSQDLTVAVEDGTVSSEKEVVDDAASIAASWISRTSSPDGDMEGGAQLGRSDTAFSTTKTHSWRPEYPPEKTVMDKATVTYNQIPRKPVGTSASKGHAMMTPHVADLNVDMHFDKRRLATSA